MLIHEIFEVQASKTPQKIAVVFGKDSITYSELNQKANQLAHLLITKGIFPESLVAISMERSINYIDITITLILSP